MVTSSAPPPVVLEVEFDNIPEPLKAIPHWIGWKVGGVKESGKYDKLPLDRQGNVVNALIPTSWMTFDEAHALIGQKKCCGIAFVLDGMPVAQNNASDIYLVGIDIDFCVTMNDQGDFILTSEAENAWEKLGCPYMEISPSGMGIRMFVYSRHLLRSGNNNHREIYCMSRFLTITGQGKGEIHDATEAVCSLHAEWFPEKHPKPALPAQNAKRTPLPESPSEIERLTSALAKLSADISRDAWRDIVWAIAATGWMCAEDIAREWSMTAAQRFDEEGFQNVWQSFDPNGGITVGTLYYRAKQAGWVEPVASQDQEQGDILNGKLFAHAHRDKLLFIHETDDVLQYTHAGWVHAPPLEEVRAAKEIVASLRQEAANIWARNPDNGLGKAKLDHAKKSSMEPRIRAMIAMAKSEPGMTAGLAEFDAKPYLVGLQNGIYDLREDRLVAASPQLLVSKRARANYTPGARCPAWIRFLDTVQPDKGVQRLLQQLVGAFLSGDTGLQKLIILYGLGANGKSTFIEVISHLLGDYGLRIPTEMLMQHQRNPQGPSPDIVGLKGCRMAYCNEIPEGSRLDEARIKELTGGDTLTGRTPYAKNNITFAPTHKLVMVGNHCPEIHDMGHGMWRRIVLIPFNVTIPLGQRDPHLLEKLNAEKSGILNWALAGARDLKRHGLRIPKSIDQATNAYKDDEDLLGEWLTDHCTLSKSAKAVIGDCYSAYKHWMRSRGHSPLAQLRFSKRLRDRGIIRAPDKRHYIGMDLNVVGQQAAQLSLY